MMTRSRLHIKGIVQGVGFRPFIYNLAMSLRLKGWVLNSTDGVHIDVEGKKETISDFIDQIELEAPPLAHIDFISVKSLRLKGYSGFKIAHSGGDASQYVKISPDVCTCPDCLRELFDPADRRYRYPFINCTNCGPRFTIIEDIPYDREKTTMRAFPMCPECQDEYDDVTDRRFHAQPNACPVCGPSVWLESSKVESGKWKRDENEKVKKWESGKTRKFNTQHTGITHHPSGGASVSLGTHSPICNAIELLRAEKILAVKGLGGFHLACNAQNERAVSLLRERKRRVMKPFAIMSNSVDKIRKYCNVSNSEALLLESIQRPIVLLEKLTDCPIAESVAPNNNYLGVMLPYTPLHYLLLDDKEILALVMTSGNISEEPIVIDNGEARKRLDGIADFFLMHDRDICKRCDDSVAMVEEGLRGEGTQSSIHLLRRSRGYAPSPIDLDFDMPQILGCGAELKNTFCLTKENHAFLSPHIGELQNVEANKYYERSIEHFKRLFRIEPEIIAYDLHPDYFSTKYALRSSKKTIGIQHHHAHIVSCMAEHGLHDRMIGVALDGTGYGTDGKIWGGEFMVVNQCDFKRIGHLKYLPLPGGDAAAKEVDRMAISYLYDAFGHEFIELEIPFVERLNKNRVEIILKMIDRGINSPMTSSCGRLFDAVSALIDVRQKISYEAQAAIELEMQAHCQDHYEPCAEPFDSAQDKLRRGNGFYGFDLVEKDDVWIVDTAPMFREIVDDMRNNLPQSILAAKFHNTVAQIVVEGCRRIRAEYELRKVALSGGVFQNRYLLRRAVKMLEADGFVPYFQMKVPTNDGGISLGQVVIAFRTAAGWRK